MIRVELAASSSPCIFVLSGRDNLRNALEDAKMLINKLRKPLSGGSSKSGSQREALLDADIGLKKQYTELVVEKKIMTDDEFWRSKLNFDAGISNLKRGRVVSILSDIDKCKAITMTPEVIASIFEMYPAVRRAYEDKVPTEYSEKEFWDRYFTSEYYAQVIKRSFYSTITMFITNYWLP
jgi:transcription initiation factor TFIIH subunit 1